MISKALFYLAFMTTSTISAQEISEEEQINRDVWYNFMQAYQDLDAMLFNQIHTDDVLRIAVDGDKIFMGKEYKDRNLEVFNNWNTQRIKQKLNLVSLVVFKGNYAYEIGIYKLTRQKGFKLNSHYGKFNVALEKVGGIWKIKMDSDTNQKGAIGEEDFISANILNC